MATETLLVIWHSDTAAISQAVAGPSNWEWAALFSLYRTLTGRGWGGGGIKPICFPYSSCLLILLPLPPFLSTLLCLSQSVFFSITPPFPSLPPSACNTYPILPSSLPSLITPKTLIFKCVASVLSSFSPPLSLFYVSLLSIIHSF